MTNSYRPLAKTIDCPRTRKELDRLVDAEMEIQNDFLCRQLRKAMKERAGNENVRIACAKYIGADNFRRIFDSECTLPCLKNVVKIADKLNLQLVLKNYPFLHSFAVPGRDFTFGAEFEHEEFAEFLFDLSLHRSARGDTLEMKKERERILENLIQPEFPIYWTTLIRYAAACGYQVNFSLKRKSQTISDRVSKEEGCFTPSKPAEKPTGEIAGACGEGGCDRGDYNALVQRLNYTI
ncbi:MAG TPA: hypothetical protein PKZ32_00285 [Candidatus Melainabacteria bacterium]|nr:hypothetical protein [Candidatus Melainabacteria bacterium]